MENQKEKLVDLLTQMVDSEDVAEILTEFVMKNYVNDTSREGTDFDYGVSGMDEDEVKEIILETITYNDNYRFGRLR